MFCCLAEPPGRAQLHSSAIGGYGTSVSNLPPHPPDYCANTAVDFRDIPGANMTKAYSTCLSGYEEKLVHPDQFTDSPACSGDSICGRNPGNKAKRSHRGRSSKRRTKSSPHHQTRRTISI